MNAAAHTADTRAGAEPPSALVYTLFFLSGVAALVYEASWSRLVGLAVGHTAQAAALVLAAYFTGLAIGQFLGGRLATRVPPLFGYGVAEVVAAAWACLIPALLDWVGAPAGSGEREWLRNSAGGRATWSFLILLPATIPLGATLPLVVETLAGGAGSRHRGAVAYGLNTAGGVIGIVAATAVLLNVVGVRASGFLAAVLSAASGLTACVVAVRRGGFSKSEKPGVTEGEKVGASRPWAVLAGISGFGILGLEVLYTRMFSLIFHNSTYTFGAVVAVFLLALSIGAALAVRLGRRYTPQQVATASFTLGGVALAVSVAAFPRLTGLRYFSFGETFTAYLAGAFGLVALFVLPPVTLLGMALPAAIQVAPSGRALGRMTAVNTLAGAAGAIAAGFFLPPLLGLWPAFVAFVALFVVAGAILLIWGGSTKLAAALVVTTSGSTVLFVAGPPDTDRDAGVELVRRWESAYGWIDVVRTGQGDALAVRQNLHYRHGSTAYAVREYRQGRLPLLLHPRPTDVAFLGLGTGLTAAAAVADKDVEKAVVVELIPEVVEAARLLTAANLGVVDHPKVEVHTDDARHHLLRTNRRFDIIVSDLFVPWESRTGYLYTVEFYETVRRRLKPGGLFCQWLALYQLGPEQFELIADSFSSVFPHATIWWGQFDAKYPIVALIGCVEPLAVGHARLEDRMEVLNAMPGGPDPDLRSPSDLPALYLGDWPRNPTRRRNTDEHPRLEFAAPVSHRGGRTLSGTALRQYFDSVLTRLPSGGVHFDAGAEASVRDDQRRRTVQRLSLFGEVKP
jgi:spermidine synthase